MYKNIEGPAKCAYDAYYRRIEDLETAAITIGPFLFSRIDYFYSKEDKETGKPYKGQSSYPRIDSPANQISDIWNSLSEGPPANGDEWCDGKPGEVYSGFVVKSATTKVIEVEIGNYFYCRGTPHGTSGVTQLNYELEPEPHVVP